MEAVSGVGRRVILKSKIRSSMVSLLFSAKTRARKRRWAEWWRRLTAKPHTVHVFLELDDPYSYLLAQYLPELKAHYDIELLVHLTQALGGDYRPRADMLAVYAQQDCQRIADELGIPFLDRGKTPPVEHRRVLIDTLARSEQSDSFAADVLEALKLYWRGDAEGVARRVDAAELTGQGDAMLQRKQNLLADLGHYNAATLFYAGELYWGVDRLHYLTDRLDALGTRHASASISSLPSMRQISQVSLPVSPPVAARELPPLELFYSFRSPYSFLALRPAFEIADAFGLEVKVRPVLPMVMRGMQVPKKKIMYIATDTAREAEKFAVPFGKFADPVGVGVERCLAVYFYALGEKKSREFLFAAGDAIWARGIDVSTDKGLRKVTARTGLFWPDVKAAIDNDDWRSIVDANRASMMESGSWGVPTLRLGEYTVWGQDRLWLLVRHIEEQCDTGDGILV
jgi:2-hydroxychromene-2-carboxylate isomerase